MKQSIINVHWNYTKDSKSIFENFATIELQHYGEIPKESSIKRELKAIGLATKPIKNIQWVKL